MIVFLGKLRGAIRVSVGIPTTAADIDKFIRFAGTFLNKAIPLIAENLEGLNLSPVVIGLD